MTSRAIQLLVLDHLLSFQETVEEALSRRKHARGRSRRRLPCQESRPPDWQMKFCPPPGVGGFSESSAINSVRPLVSAGSGRHGGDRDVRPLSRTNTSAIYSDEDDSTLCRAGGSR
jgi:hypothetical protein